ncbi:GLIPR1 1 [Labeo rohita]|uniref:GLIPR1 1 n=1 Tax=Labeo rohita TaxID=84645 RepID=A0A498P3S1_LABRO|nr:GLIPR1 1 [Labeo rohita]
MSANLQVLISVTVLLGLVSCEPVFDIKDPAFIEGCVREHNRHRTSVSPSAANMRYMTRDEGLAVTAQAWARFCVFKHNIHLREVKRMHPIFTSVGENIWAGAPYSSFKPESAVKSWADEVRDYHYDTNQCTKVCGHYTQVVWADSYKVGCAAQACPNGVAETHFSTQPGVIFVCNYATAGNYRYEYLVDFLDLSFPDVRPERDHAYEEIKNRVNVMRHVVLNGGLWDDLYIGFNNRMSRDPDVYHHK